MGEFAVEEQTVKRPVYLESGTMAAVDHPVRAECITLPPTSTVACGGHTIAVYDLPMGTVLFKGMGPVSRAKESALWFAMDRATAKVYAARQPNGSGAIYKYELTRPVRLFDLLDDTNLDVLIDAMEKISPDDAKRFRSRFKRFRNRHSNGLDYIGALKDGIAVDIPVDEEDAIKVTDNKGRGIYVHDQNKSDGHGSLQMCLEEQRSGSQSPMSCLDSDTFRNQFMEQSKLCGKDWATSKYIRTSDAETDNLVVKYVNQLFGMCVDGWCHNASIQFHGEVVLFDRRLVTASNIYTDEDRTAGVGPSWPRLGGGVPTSIAMSMASVCVCVLVTVVGSTM